jgi:hypothetical protein
MRRREFIAGLGSAAAWPVIASAQVPAVAVIGYLGAGTSAAAREVLAAFHLGLSETGYIEGRNVIVEYRWAEDRLDRLPAIANDLVRRQVMPYKARLRRLRPRPQLDRYQSFSKSVPIPLTLDWSRASIGHGQMSRASST